MRVETARRLGATVVMVSAISYLSPSVGERGPNPETGAITTLVQIHMAEVAYAAVHGHFDTLDCLAKPGCTQTWTGHDGQFLSPQFAARAGRSGYRIEFFSGPSAWDSSVPERSKSAVSRYALVAVPVKTGSVDRRAFCIDEAGAIYRSPAGTVPRVDDGRCIDMRDPLR